MDYPYKKKIRDERGRFVRIYGRTPEELAEKVAARQKEVAYRAALLANPTVAMYAKTWMELQPSSLSASRLSDFDLSLRLHILPHIGSMHLMDVTAMDIAALMHAEEHLSQSMQQKIVYVIKGIFALALAEGYIEANPCATLKAGGRAPKQKDSLTKEQRRILIDAVRGTRVYPFVMVALFAGLRREEALGLKWDMVTLDGDTPCINVRRALRWETGKPPQLDEELKTDAAARIVTIPDALVECLREAKAGSSSEFVICDTHGQPCTQAAWRSLWGIVERRQTDAFRPKKKRSISKELDENGKKKNRRGERPGVPHTIDFYVTPHTLRRSYATELILGGCDVKTAQYLLGHTKAETTLNWYAKVMGGRPDETILKVRAAFGGTT